MTRHDVVLVADDRDLAAEVERSIEGLGCAFAVRSPDADGEAGTPAGAVVIVDVPSGGVAHAIVAAAALSANARAILLLHESDEEALGVAAARRLDVVVKPVRERELRAVVELAICRLGIGEAVQEVEQRFFDTSIDMLCFLGFDGRFRRLNPAWERTLGFSRAELMSRPFIEFVHPDDRERTLAQNLSVRGGGQALNFENRYLCRDGSYRWFRWNAAPDPTSRLIYSVARDVTAAREAEEERERLVVQLQAALDEVRTLRSILPICSYCRNIRDEENNWHSAEAYIARHTPSQFSHGICPSCMAIVAPSFDEPA